jgi:pantetheine-phosphate adenylyltransferase|tara:strand:- start:839 stop:1315 length:477 start_codon:yes stop_codon:yes gene_type:complete
MIKTAVFPGSFAPFTIGHKSIVDRMLPLFDKIIIAIGNNSLKNDSYSIDKKINWIKKIYLNQSQIEVISYEGLTIELCNKKEADYIIRGIRDERDFKFEQKISQNNKELAPKIETLLISTLPIYSHISSSIVRDIINHKGDISKLVPNPLELYKSFDL